MRTTLHLVPPTPRTRLLGRIVPTLLGIAIAVASALPLLLLPTP